MGCAEHFGATAMGSGRSRDPGSPVAVDPVHEGIYEVEYRQSLAHSLFRRRWRDGVWAIPGARCCCPPLGPKRWRVSDGTARADAEGPAMSDNSAPLRRGVDGILHAQHLRVVVSVKGSGERCVWLRPVEAEFGCTGEPGLCTNPRRCACVPDSRRQRGLSRGTVGSNDS